MPRKFKAQETARKDFTALYGKSKQIACGKHEYKGAKP
jgi:hypothetical protein